MIKVYKMYGTDTKPMLTLPKGHTMSMGYTSDRYYSENEIHDAIKRVKKRGGTIDDVFNELMKG